VGSGQDHRGRPRAAARPRLQPLTRRVVEVAPERLDGWLARFEAANPGADAPQRVASLARFDHAPLAVVLVRRGGYAVGLADAAGALTASKVGTRHVQSRTAAGGWSQQRFARRRGNQADELVRAVAEHAGRLLPRDVTGVVLGGDRALVRSVLADPRLAWLAQLPARELYDLPDPRRSVLEDAVRRGRAVRVTIEEQPAR
jgi:hypothetical protein